MGKYSLESFERYPMLRCRPKEIREAIAGAGKRAFETVRVQPGGEMPKLRMNTLLEISVSRESCGQMDVTESRLAGLAARYGDDPFVLGITLTSDASLTDRRWLWEIAARAFAPKRFFVPVTDGEQLRFAMGRGFAGGLLADVTDHPYDVCEAFARHHAQQLYRQMPVLVRFASADEKLAQYAKQWHAAAVEGLDAPAGWRIALRRITLPKALSCGGYAPMRFWLTNRGPSFCHDKAHLALRLKKDGRYTQVSVHDVPAAIALADRVHNEIVRLPAVAPGEYALEFALLTERGEALVLANEGRTADGYYPACSLTLDGEPRPEYETIWDDFFPDGYYPLEDPKEPV